MSVFYFFYSVPLLLIVGNHGGLMFLLVRMPPDQAIRVRTLAGDVANGCVLG